MEQTEGAANLVDSNCTVQFPSLTFHLYPVLADLELISSNSQTCQAVLCTNLPDL